MQKVRRETSFVQKISHGRTLASHSRLDLMMEGQTTNSNKDRQNRSNKACGFRASLILIFTIQQSVVHIATSIHIDP